MFKVGDKVRLSKREFGLVNHEQYGVLEVWKISLAGARPVIYTKGGTNNIQESDSFSLIGWSSFDRVGPAHKITVNTRRKW